MPVSLVTVRIFPLRSTKIATARTKSIPKEILRKEKLIENTS